MTRTRVQWLAILLPALLVGLFEFVRHDWFVSFMAGVEGNAIASLVVAAAVYGFVRYFIGVVRRTERDLGRARAEAAVLAERQRIRREIHDGVAQALLLVRVRLDELDAAVAGADRAAAHARVAAVKAQVAAADDQVRAAIADLKAQSRAEDPAEALRRDAAKLAEALGLELSLALDDLPRLDAQGRQHLAAIVSEAMSNAARHGGATRVALSAERDRLVIADNGRGFPESRPPGAGHGLVIMAERAELIGGTLVVESEAGQGTRLTLTWKNGDHR